MNKKNVPLIAALLIFALILLPVRPVCGQNNPAPNETGSSAKIEARPIVTAGEKPAEENAPEVGTTEEKSVPVSPGNVTVNFKGADIKTVLAYIAEVSGIDIVPAPDVKGIVDLKLTNKPWNTALDIIVRNYGFVYEREGDIIRVITVDKLKQEELVSQVFPLNYSKAKDGIDALKTILSERGKVMYDERTNTLLVTDIPTNIYKIGKVIERLDKKTAEVLIEARVIETALDNNEKLGINWNVKMSAHGAKAPTTIPFKGVFDTKDGAAAYFPQVQTGQPQTTTVVAGGTSQTDTAALFPSVAGGLFSFPFATTTDFTYGSLDFSEFSAVLEMIKSRANTDIVSNPRIATLNNVEALINVGQTLNLPKYERNSSTGKMEITGYDPKDLGIILKVTPHVNDNNEIVVDLAPEITDLLRYDTLDAASGVVAPVFSTRIAKTKVMIRDGDTIFIGGLIRENNVDTRTKIPIIGDVLGDVPYIGMLFTHKSIEKQKTELIFFITVNLMSTDRTVKGAPVASKAYAPVFKLTQEEEKAAVKKRLNKR